MCLAFMSMSSAMYLRFILKIVEMHQLYRGI